MAKVGRKHYFDHTWQDVDFAFVPLKFSLPSKKIRDDFISLLSHHNSLADLGCGSGGNNLSFQKINPDLEYTGIDISSQAISKANRKNTSPKTHYLIADLEKSNSLPGQFDLIYCSQLIEHISADQKFIDQLSHSLTPFGYLLLSTVYKRKHAFYIYKNIRGERVLAPDHLNEFTDVNDLLNKLKKSGFKIIDYDLTLFRFPLIDFALKFLMKHFKSKILYGLVNSPFIMFLRYYLSVPIPGFYNFQILAKKAKP